MKVHMYLKDIMNDNVNVLIKYYMKSSHIETK